MRIKRDDSEEPGIAMAPLIDCVFLLLIFFLVASTLKKAHNELELELPYAQHAIETKSRYDTLIIEVAKDGTIQLEGEPVTKQLLRRRLREAKAENPNRRVRIDADRRTAAQYIVYVLDLCQFERLNNVGLRTRD